METATRPPIGDLKPLPELQRELAHLFPSPAGLEWEIRIHKAEYVAAGAIFKIGRRWLAHPPTFKATTLAIGARRAQEWAKRSCAA
jgi:hypothetical protein